ncbi:protein EXPRESSION OF TERPENOIDS 1-like [Rutidosis leptorrhynchoides]|uniref:protein EXPRESSION OF TERPENOIDS 1-like n=1 Tax=Rutidosis leptorrhynchoides TaxID=125765 RepID=UPI003A9A128E
MAGFFSLGSASYNPTHQQQQQQQQQSQNPNSKPTESSSWCLYSTTTTRNNTTTTKDFELWQPTHHASPAAATMGGGGGGGGRLINFSDESTWSSAAFVRMGHGGVGGGGVSCQDCGNQAKKDCPHMRCRTCCKSKGFQCQTHVKSTWVPVAKRRERHQYLTGGGTQQNQNGRRASTTNTKRTRSLQDHDHDQNPNLVDQIAATTATTVGYNHYSTGLEISNFPSEVMTPTNFKCVRVSSIDDIDDQLAYQATVNIGGHMFKGILYDQGPDGHLLNLTTMSPANSTAAATNFIGHSLYSSLDGNDYMTNTPFFHQISRD